MCQMSISWVKLYTNINVRISQPMISGFLPPQHGTFSGCRWRRWPPELEGGSHYIEKAVADGQQEVVLKPGDRASC